MVDIIVLFDLNGTLDTPEGLEFYKRCESRPNTMVGVLTANTLFNARRFVKEEDINPDIVTRGFVKSKDLMFIDVKYDIDERVYVGNSITDRLASKIAGWHYISISDIK